MAIGFFFMHDSRNLLAILIRLFLIYDGWSGAAPDRKNIVTLACGLILMYELERKRLVTKAIALFLIYDGWSVPDFVSWIHRAKSVWDLPFRRILGMEQDVNGPPRVRIPIRPRSAIWLRSDAPVNNRFARDDGPEDRNRYAARDDGPEDRNRFARDTHCATVSVSSDESSGDVEFPSLLLSRICSNKMGTRCRHGLLCSCSDFKSGRLTMGIKPV
jgi:hypothetical protein